LWVFWRVRWVFLAGIVGHGAVFCRPSGIHIQHRRGRQRRRKAQNGSCLGWMWEKSHEFGSDSAECGAGRLNLQRKERKSWKREEGEVGEPRCRSPELARPCLGPARPTHGSLQTHAVGLAEAKALWSFLWAHLLFCLTLIFCNW
jgi:hypothetical protein